MSYDTARQQHIRWLHKQIEEKMSALTEAEVRVSQLRADIEYFKLMLNIHEKANTDALSQDTSIMLNSDQSSNGESNQSQTNNLIFADNTKYGVGDDNKRSPKEMLRAEFANKTLAEVAEIVLNRRNEALTADEIARAIFITQDNDEYVRARNSLSTELRRGAREGRWQQIGRGSFASTQVAYLRDKNVVTPHFSTNGNRTNN
ncbi:hypothetical protein I8748_34330 [Nostoc sp. CENA67]|uniref:Uncharacterized protein n=1 Tax=Amazonocrinis nigriterrae CENA67 TaxID=2794033 RepID=A0A8J7I0R3_9NOST|nr:hypothetical protein [Amazonocrinis nigriterrae]MBH8567170.1 hypothetical protein [Amazonocrinis nigriterrae CENA67]